MENLKLTIDRSALSDLNEFIGSSFNNLHQTDEWNLILNMFIGREAKKIYNKIERRLQSMNVPKSFTLNKYECTTILFMYHWFAVGDEPTRLPGVYNIIQQIGQKTQRFY